MSNQLESFVELDLNSTKPTSVPMEEVSVLFGVNPLFQDYAKAFIAEAARKNPNLADRVQLTVKEMEDYIAYLLYKRIEYVKDECKDFRRLWNLYIPVWIQYNLRMVGIVTNRRMGIKLIPEYDGIDVISYDEAVLVSEKIGQFIDDLQIVQDAMPRTHEGDDDVMSTALIADYVRSFKEVEHVSATYVSAFLGMRLKQEAALASLYRIQYDDIGFIASALSHHKGLF